MTDPAAFYADARDRIGRGKLSEVVRELADRLEKIMPPNRPARDRAVQLEAQLADLERSEAAGVVGYESAQLSRNQIRLATLGLLNDLENGMPPAGAEKREGKVMPALRKYWPVLVGGALVLLAAILLLPRLMSGGGGGGNPNPPLPPTEPLEPKLNCPAFDAGSSLNVLVLPFRALAGPATQLHTVILQRLAVSSDQYRLNLSFHEYGNDADDVSDYPIRPRDAESLANSCGAQLIVWGTTEETPLGDIVVLFYRFLKSSTLDSTLLDQSSNMMTVDTVSSLSSITAQGSLVKDLEDHLYLLFGLIAAETSQDSASIALLESAQVAAGDSVGFRAAQLSKASGLAKLNRPEAAIAAYSELLEEQPYQHVALSRRADLLMKQGDMDRAIEDLSKVVDLNPADAESRVKRAEAYIAADRLNLAKMDLQKLQDAPARVPNGTLKTTVAPLKIKQLKSKWEQSRARQERELNNLKSQESNRGKQLDYLERRATLEMSLERYQDASKTARTLRALRPDLERAYQPALELSRITADSAEIRRIRSAAQSNRVELKQD